MMQLLRFICFFWFQTVQAGVYVMNNGIFSTIIASFDDAVSHFGPELFHVDGFLLVASPPDACNKLIPVRNYTCLNDSSKPSSNNISKLSFIALIERGKCHFDVKVFNAQMAGYSAVIVHNDVDHVIFPMKGDTLGDQVIIPSVMVDKRAGEQLLLYTCSDSNQFIISMVSFYSLPLKYVLLSLLVLVGLSLLILIGCFAAHLCNLWRRVRRCRLSKRHLRRLETKRFVKGQMPYETCPICLEDYKEREKLRFLPCHHAFHISCIDPWLLRNRRRCPVCNQIVHLPGAPRVFSDEDVHRDASESREPHAIGPLQRVRLFCFSCGRAARMDRSPSVGSTNTLLDEGHDESAPLLSHIVTADSVTVVNSDVSGICNQNQSTMLHQPCAVICDVTVEDDHLLDLTSENSPDHPATPPNSSTIQSEDSANLSEKYVEGPSSSTTTHCLEEVVGSRHQLASHTCSF